MAPCYQRNCVICCHGQVVPLLEEDVNRLVQTGHYDAAFAKVISGWKILQTFDGRCFFFENGRCTAGEFRPKACQLAPIVYNEEEDKVELDERCPHLEDFTITPELETVIRDFARALVKEREYRERTGNF